MGGAKRVQRLAGIIFNCYTACAACVSIDSLRAAHPRRSRRGRRRLTSQRRTYYLFDRTPQPAARPRLPACSICTTILACCRIRACRAVIAHNNSVTRAYFLSNKVVAAARLRKPLLRHFVPKIQKWLRRRAPKPKVVANSQIRKFWNFVLLCFCAFVQYFVIRYFGTTRSLCSSIQRQGATQTSDHRQRA
jgi:hypothetical protein